MRKLRKDRVFRHMARENPDYKSVRVSRDELRYLLDWADEKEYIENLTKKYLGWWIRLAKIKHGEDVLIDIWNEYDIDFNMYKFGARRRPGKYSRPINAYKYGLKV